MAVLDPVRPAFRAVGQTVVPEAARLTESEWAAVEDIVEQALATRPPRLQRQLVTLIRLLQWLPLFRYGRPFTALDPTHRTRFLAAIQDAPVLLLRRGFWGLRTLVLMGYYARPVAATEIGYQADPRGWEARRP
ncbi:MAG: gluconate 2-dehydrogenase subunit 3 family protein [Gemmatimonadetes bacterium]|nr:gluconate 2-dehydrogenase subunit 3 family protein [Gemmatimonadota bacterium]